MRADLVGLGLAITLLSTSLAHGQVIIDVSKVAMIITVQPNSRSSGLTDLPH